ncbi:S1C family serine protease [Bovifimicola ammoniilytica]|jgi:serine protease Do|uniref:S1C family serine protease n=1 Tax=Bovifimicola ammoniilytica TaxID=2981720 RepID=UPI000821251E|nr:trypsin-like peptidase domain-containing protein [Bovifimicola ammoniilytica]MCU6752401.1 trypsin-like peptidase domain-containing protein [Bovifimicola ammoniilytica]SCJ23537.1 Putative serine protease HhoB precursor [uncultured Eubacterium sp.]
MTNEFDFNNENNTSEETSVNGANEVNTTTGDDTNNNFFSSISNETDNNTSDTSSENFSDMAANDSQSTNFVMVDRTSEDTEAMKARQQVEKEKSKFEAKRRKAAAKLEKKEAKKKAKAGKGHGVVFKTVRLVVCAAVFGVVATGTMYFTGDSLGIFKNNSKEAVVIPSTSVGAGNTGITGSEGGTTLQTAADKTTTSSSGETVITDVSGVVKNVMPSVVAITSTQLVQSGYSGSLYDYYFGNGNSNNNQYEEQTGAGSGIIIGQNDTELLVVTNNHVVEGADSLQVQFIDGETVDAAIKGTDSEKDLAVVAVKLSDIKKSTLEQIKVATLGDSDKLEVGEGTIAIGNALGYGQSVTTGVVSALNREVQYENRTMKLIQTNAAINPGNSGGALLNSKGEVIGINAAKYSSSSVEGMGFAIPVSSVKDVIENLMNKETLTKVDSDKKGYLNIYGRDVTSTLSETYSVPTGVYVIEVIEGGAADKAGIEKSNVITKINGESVSSMEDLQRKLEYYEKGTEVTLTIQYAKGNEYKEKEVKVTLGDEMK